MLTEEQVVDCVCEVTPVSDGASYGWEFDQIDGSMFECYWTSESIWDMFGLLRFGLNSTLEDEGPAWNTIRYGIACYFDDILCEFIKDKRALQWLAPIGEYVDSVFNHPDPDWRSWSESKAAIDYILDTQMPDELQERWSDCAWKVLEDDVDRFYEVTVSHLIEHTNDVWKIYFRLGCGWNDVWTDLATVEVDEDATPDALQAQIHEALEQYTFVRS